MIHAVASIGGNGIRILILYTILDVILHSQSCDIVNWVQ